MKIIVNQKEMEIEEDISLQKFIDNFLTNKPKFFAVSVNGKIIHKNNWQTHILKEGDKIDIVSVFQGG